MDLLADQYRPERLDDVILPEEYQKLFTEFIKNKDIPHLLFYGPPGTGKTSTAMVLKHEILKTDYDFLMINASLERGIDLIRNKITDFISTPPMNSPIKIILLDEADGLTEDALKSLKALIESEKTRFHKVRFIFTVNYENKLIDAIISRLTPFSFDYIPVDDIVQHVSSILTSKQINYNPDDVFSMVSDFHPDVRSVFNYMAKFIYSKEFKYEGSSKSNRASIVNTLYQSILKLQNGEQLINEDFNEIFGYIGNNPQIVESIIMDIMKREDIKPFSFVIMNRYLNTMNTVISKILHLQSMLYEIFYAARMYNS